MSPDKLTISQVAWYFLPGMYALLSAITPIACLSPSSTSALLSSLGAIGFAIIGLVIGFLIDGLRLYRFRPGYKTIRAEFFGQLQNDMGVSRNPYFILDQIVALAQSNEQSAIRFNHSIWIMLGQMTILSWLHAMLWILLPVAVWLFSKPPALWGHPVSFTGLVAASATAALIAVLVGVRLMWTSLEEQNKTNSMYREYAQAKKTEILRRLL
jgi:hypothetical protein